VNTPYFQMFFGALNCPKFSNNVNPLIQSMRLV